MHLHYYISIIVAAWVIYSVILQMGFFQAHHPHLFKLEVWLIAGMIIFPAAAVAAGNIAGAAAFPGSNGGSGWSLVFVAIPISLIGTTILAIGNSIYMRSGFNKIVKVFGQFLYSVLWFFTVALSVLAYSLAYTLHDPSTE
jgi:hypothetical protein